MGQAPFALAIWMHVLVAAPAAAQTIVTSAGPDDVDVTLYRAPNRAADTPIELDWLEGFALISETRRVAIPAGESEIRFEGVAGGIVPQSAIIGGFPEGVVERNRDAYLLSASTLLDRSLGRRVHLRRTSRSTGAVDEQVAIIRSGAGGAVVLQTRDGFEALRCTGQNETLVYDEVPAGLSARPTLSVRARSSRAVTATVTLAYLSSGFDWQANYIATLSADGSRADLFAWLTLASMDETSFRNADTQAVAGRLNRAEPPDNDADDGGGQISLRCWPAGTTSNLGDARRVQEIGLDGTTRTEDLINSLPQAFAGQDEQNIVVTAMRARQEDLGDLKLYRIPEPVTVAANSQKQVAFLEQPAVRVDLVYRSRLAADASGSQDPPNRVIVTRNRREEGLGVPLPAGSVQLFGPGARPILLGEGTIADRAVGEDVEIEVGEAIGVGVDNEDVDLGRNREAHVLTVRSDHDAPIRFEAEFDVDAGDTFRPETELPRRHGRPLWSVTVPANGSASLRYRLRRTDD